MEVYAMTCTSRPIDAISVAAGFCYGKSDAKDKRVARCIASGHLSVLEHASITFEIFGISRACMAQLTRHRMASFCVESQRYCKYDEELFEGEDWYVIPPAFDCDVVSRDAYKSFVKQDAEHYMIAVNSGIKPEDARYLLPNAMKTNLVMSCNARELFHILEMRLDGAAQWEIRELAEKLKEAAKAVSPQWCVLVEMWEQNRG